MRTEPASGRPSGHYHQWRPVHAWLSPRPHWHPSHPIISRDIRDINEWLPLSEGGDKGSDHHYHCQRGPHSPLSRLKIISSSDLSSCGVWAWAAGGAAALVCCLYAGQDSFPGQLQQSTLHYMTCQVWTVLVGLVSRLLRSLFAGLEEEGGQLGPEAGAQCCPDAGAMVSEASVSVSLGQLSVYHVSMSLTCHMLGYSRAHSLLLLGSALPDPHSHPFLPRLHAMSGVQYENWKDFKIKLSYNNITVSHQIFSNDFTVISFLSICCCCCCFKQKKVPHMALDIVNIPYHDRWDRIGPIKEYYIYQSDRTIQPQVECHVKSCVWLASSNSWHTQ